MVGVVVNNMAGRGRAFKRYNGELRPLLVERVVDFVEIIEESIGRMQKRLWQLIEKGLKFLVVVGGDGTLNRVVEVVRGTEVNIIPFPAGTGNDFAKSLGKEGIRAERIIECLEGKCDRIMVDIGYVKADSEKHIFINGLGIGFDGEVLKRLRKIPFLKGDPLYFSAVILSLFKRKSRRFRVITDDGSREKELVVFDIGNGKYLGGGFNLFPNSNFTDRRLSYIGIKNDRLHRVVKVLIDVLKGHLYNNPLIEVGEFENVKLEFEEKVSYHTDGDLRKEARFFEIGTLNERLGVLI